jgi:hypothetical protein
MRRGTRRGVGRSRRRLRLWHCAGYLAALVAVWPAVSHGLPARQTDRPPAIVTWTLEAPPSVQPGRAFDATLNATVAAGWKFYAMDQTVEGPRPLEVTAADPAFVLVGPVRPDVPPRSVKDTIWSALVAFHDRSTRFRVPLRPSSTAGRQVIKLKVRYQACSDEICLRPTTVTVTRDVVLNSMPLAQP